MTSAKTMSQSTIDTEWPLIEEAVFRLFGGLAGKKSEHVEIGPHLTELGWAEIEAEYPIASCEVLFRAQGRYLTHTDALSRVMLAELATVVDGEAHTVVLPSLRDGARPGAYTDRVDGIVVGPPRGRVVVPIAEPGSVSIAVVDSEVLHAERIDTFDPTVHWTRVSGPLKVPTVEATREWKRAMAAAQLALATEIVSVTDEMLRIAVEHVSARAQFGSSIGSFQSPRHALAETSAELEGARALLAESWRYGGQMAAQAAKAVAARAHRSVADVTLQVCGAIGLTAEHDMHRYVRRGLQLDALCGSHHRLADLVAERIFDTYSPERGLPSVVAWGP